MLFTQEGFTTAEARYMHQNGWSDTFEKLANVASNELSMTAFMAFSWLWLL
jgi:hypothetical protein